jgi:hypothetical protein
MTPTKFVYSPEYEEITAVFVQNRVKSGIFLFVECYSHEGQHSGCSQEWVTAQLPATPEQYASLLSELQALGYEIEVV